MAPHSNQHLSPNAAENVSPATKHGFVYTLRKSLSTISLSSRRSADTIGSNINSLRKQPQGASNIYDDTFDISKIPTDVFASALRGALASPGQDCTGPYPRGGTQHVRYSHSMCDLSGHMPRTAKATDSPNHPPPCQSRQPNVPDVVPPNHEPVAPNHEPVVSPSARTRHRREARVPLSASAANIRAVSHDDLDEPSEARYRRISTSYDWLFNSPVGPRPHDFGAETLDLIGPDPFRWVPTRAHTSELQRSLQVPESTASGALRLATSTSYDQMPSNPEVKHAKSHDERHQEDVWWVPQRPKVIEGRTSRGERNGKVQPRQVDSIEYHHTRL